MVRENEIYRHFKNPNHLYKIIAIGKHFETLEDFVVYQALYESHNAPMFQIWIRPLSIFESLVDGKPRFEKAE